eukprot:CAMPEP_0116898598 /NCGR_PEP_ID=MMETSP0467-20121206/7304_1 /TAXON_ID=283647 /ORGANISM="Mesodinium pulex, Strain SPMC105" /LENGTH=46 /DNA_ID= /DNA_START= /DNA_END= /DNA_ORIENTATION=
MKNAKLIDKCIFMFNMYNGNFNPGATTNSDGVMFGTHDINDYLSET